MGWKRIKGNDLMGDSFVCPHCHRSQSYGDTPFCPYCGEKVREITDKEKELADWFAEEYEAGREWA